MTGLEIGAVVALGAAVVPGVLAVRAWVRLRGSRVIACPENRQPAGVELDLRYAALTAAVGRPHLRLRDCSRWPERASCGQICLMEIEEAPEDGLVRRVRRDLSCPSHPDGGNRRATSSPSGRHSDGGAHPTRPAGVPPPTPPPVEAVRPARVG